MDENVCVDVYTSVAEVGVYDHVEGLVKLMPSHVNKHA
jgi:hypothetical protein